MSKRILLVDDHTMFRAGLNLLVKSQFAEAQIAEAGDGASAIGKARELKPDLVIMDLHLPDQNGIDVSRQILAELPDTRIVVLSAESNLSYVNDALEAGVSAYLLKTNAPAELPLAIQSVLAGKLYLCPEANTAVLEDYRRNLAAAHQTSKQGLSAREREVLRLIAEGLRTKEIAERLKVGVRTIETFRRRLIKKLECDSTAELVRYALREGIIKP